MTTKIVQALFCAAMVASPLAAQAQPQADIDIIPEEMLDSTRSLDDDEITFCLNMDSVLVDLDRAVGQAIGDALLLEVSFHEVDPPLRARPYDYRIPLRETAIYVVMNNDCDAFAGMRLSPGQMPDWMTISQPYFESGYEFLTTDESYTSLSDIPPGTDIGSRLGSQGDAQFNSYLRSLPEGQRQRRVPYPDNATLIERLRDGSVQTIFIWELAPLLATDGNLDELGVVQQFEPPFATRPLQFGMAFLSQNTFVRGLVDEAIVQLRQDGTLDSLIAEYTAFAAGRQTD